MKNIVLLVLGFFISASYCCAQKNDTNSLPYKAFIKEYDDSKNANREQALKAADKIENLSLQQNNLYFLSDAYIKKAIIYYYDNNYGTARIYSGRAIENAKRSNNYQVLLRATNLMGAVYYNLGDLKKSEYYYLEKIKAAQLINDSAQEIGTYYNIGLIYFQQGNYLKSADYNFKALRFFERAKDTFNILSSLHSIGYTYMNLEDIPSSIKFYRRALFYAKDFKDKYELNGIYIDISTAFSALRKIDSSIYYVDMAIALSRKEKDDYHYTIALNNKASYYLKLKDYKGALALCSEAEKLNVSAERKLALCDVYENMSACFYSLKQSDSAFKYANKGYKIAIELGQTKSLSSYSRIISTIYEAKHQPDSALTYFKLHFQYNDSLKKESQLRGIAQKEFLFEKQNQEQLRAKEQQLAQTKLDKQKQINLIVIIASLVITLFLIIGIINFRQKQKANALVLLQKKALEEKNKEVLESITYAKRLQEAILPPLHFISSHIPNSFILYKPKDIVAGDFYWAEKIGDLFFIVAADSTGHGVPGAIVSVVCSNALNRAVKEFNLTEPGKILDKTREIVLETFAKATSEVKDGMDISLLCIDAKNKTAFWSGANNPLWYVKNNELIEIKADKQSIGKTEFPKPFTTHKITPIENTSFYLFTDGYADQFGGDKGKKFKYKQFLDLLLATNHLSPGEQLNIISKQFEDWKGKLEQVDDVCVIGIKL